MFAHRGERAEPERVPVERVDVGERVHEARVARACASGAASCSAPAATYDGWSGSTVPGTRRITKNGAPIHCSSSSTASGSATGIAVVASARCTSAWRVRSYTGKMPPPAGGSRATSSSSLSTPSSVHVRPNSRVSLEYPVDGLRSEPRRTSLACGCCARTHRVKPSCTASRSRCCAATVTRSGRGRGGWRRTRRASAAASSSVSSRYTVLTRRTPPHGIGGLPALGAQRLLVDLVRAGDGQVLDDADVTAAPTWCRGRAARRGTPRTRRDRRSRPARSSSAAITWSPVRLSGTAYTATPAIPGMRPRMRSIGAAAKFSPSTRIQSPLRPANQKTPSSSRYAEVARPVPTVARALRRRPRGCCSSPRSARRGVAADDLADRVARRSAAGRASSNARARALRRRSRDRRPRCRCRRIACRAHRSACRRAGMMIDRVLARAVALDHQDAEALPEGARCRLRDDSGAEHVLSEWSRSSRGWGVARMWASARPTVLKNVAP